MIKFNRTYPAGWKIKSFGDIATRFKEKVDPEKSSEIYPCIELQHINQEVGTINGFIYSDQQKSSKNKFYSGHVLFGKLRPYLKKYWHAEFDGVCSSEIWVLDSKGLCSNEFLFLLIQTDRFNQIANVSTGTKMPRADWGFISDYPFAIPPLEEQASISRILKRWDTLISNLKKLISAKKSYKKGLMQQLLSGKMRFPEFEREDWVEVKLKKFFIYDSKKNTEDESLPIMSCSKVHGITKQENIFDKRIASKDISNYKIIEKNDLVYDPMLLWDASIGFVDEVEKGVISPAYYTFKFKEQEGYRPYFKFLFDTHYMRYQYKAISQGTNTRRRKAPRNAFLKIPIKLPSSIEEQKKIADTLLAAQREIELLQEEKKLIERQKKGLMQKLLTGKVRVHNLEV
jgi:type I restriction enzyme S subunit